jgi:hypothetical protein
MPSSLAMQELWKNLSPMKKVMDMVKKQKFELIKPYLGMGFRRFHFFHDVPFEVAKTLLTGLPNVEPDDEHNESPTNAKMVAIAEQYEGTLDGAVQEDEGIWFDGFTIKASSEIALALRKTLKPNEFTRLPDSKFQFWWD